MKKKFLVIGLGRFGKSVLKELAILGHEVVGCDQDARTINDTELDELATYLVEGDASNRSVLEELEVSQFDSVIVSIGEDFESAILVVIGLRELGCSSIYAKASDARRGKGLQGAGATKVIYPEEETGKRIARHIANPNVLQYIQIAPHCSAIELPVPKEFIGKSLEKIDFRRKYNALVIMIAKEHEEYPIISPNPAYLFEKGDCIFVIGDDHDLERLRRKFS